MQRVDGHPISPRPSRPEEALPVLVASWAMAMAALHVAAGNWMKACEAEAWKGVVVEDTHGLCALLKIVIQGGGYVGVLSLQQEKLYNRGEGGGLVL